MAKLVNKASRQAYLLEGQAVVIGRHMACSIKVLERRVSRNHCLLLASEEGWVLQDRGSTLGTYVNGEFVTQPRRLQPGDRIKVGRTEFVFEDKDDVGEGLSLERVRHFSARGLTLPKAKPDEPEAPRKRRASPRAIGVAIGLLALAAAAVFQLAPHLKRDSATHAVRRAAALVGARRASELWAMLSTNRRFMLSVEELQDRLSALPEAAIVTLRSLEVDEPRATNRGVVVPISIRLDGERLQGEVVLFREGDAWKIHSAPVEWAQRLSQ